MNQEEMDKIVFQCLEQILLKMPEVIGNLMKEHESAIKINKKLFGDNPEFKDNLELVRPIIDKLEKDNIDLTYEEIIDKAAPIIKERLKIAANCPIETKPDKESLNLNVGNLSSNKPDPLGFIE